MVGGWWNRDCSTDVGEEKKVLVVLADPKNEDTWNSPATLTTPKNFNSTQASADELQTSSRDQARVICDSVFGCI